ncbi:MAG: LLM class flavin-dependent oxidoreductase [Deltaproteobacteria bacterium]|nr:LLM class flavin-dependent oxidoreductase [Deltaproteobacteria bacterium]
MKLSLSVLDLSPVGRDTTPSQAIRDSIALAQHADRLGFTRYWFAEHHNMANIATSAPEVLIAHAAAVTSRIRLGAGGIMVPNHAPLHVVETFRTLEALAPGRIDLGLGRAPGTDPVASAALRRTDAEVNSQLAELLAFEHGRFPASHPFAKIAPMPSDVAAGQLWMLGSTLAGATIAADIGVPYAFAGHFSFVHAADALRHYRNSYTPSRAHPTPHAMLALTCVCAPTDAEAERLATPLRLAIVRNRTGRRGPIPTVEEALATTLTPDEQAIADEFFAGAVIGAPATVADRLRALAHDLGADELMLSTLLPSLDDRRRSLELVAAALA